MMLVEADLKGAYGYLNGEFKKLHALTISPMDRGFLYGDGCYEVIPVYHKRPFLLSEHLSRWFSNLEKIELPLVENKKEIERLLSQLINMTEFENEYIYLQATRGTYSKREHAFPEKTEATLFAYTLSFTPPEFSKISLGLNAITHKDIRWERCDIKSVSLLGNVLLREKARKQKADETILLRDGFVTEGASSNVFIVKSGLVITPPLSHAILPGITRAKVIEILSQQNIPFEEKAISESLLNEADEIWLTSSTKEIVPVAMLNGQRLRDINKVWEPVFKRYQKEHAS
jgi:D-alanine transaminase